MGRPIHGRSRPVPPGITLLQVLWLLLVAAALGALTRFGYDSQDEKVARATMLADVRRFVTTASGAVPENHEVAQFNFDPADSEMAFTTAPDGRWALLVSNRHSTTICGILETRTGSGVPECARAAQGGMQVSSSSPIVGERVSYAVDGYGGAFLISWDFGDGSSCTGAPALESTIVHAYAAPGRYAVRVGIVSNDGIFSASYQQVVSEGDRTPLTLRHRGSLPVAAFGVSSNPATVGSRVNFDASSSRVAHESIESRLWDFGDGNTGRGTSPVHLYATPGDYVVTLVVKDASGRTDALQQMLSVR